MLGLDVAEPTWVQNLTTIALVPEIWLVPTAHQNLNGLRDLATPLLGMLCHPWASNCYDQPIHVNVCLSNLNYLSTPTT